MVPPAAQRSLREHRVLRTFSVLKINETSTPTGAADRGTEPHRRRRLPGGPNSGALNRVRNKSHIFFRPQYFFRPLR